MNGIDKDIYLQLNHHCCPLPGQKQAETLLGLQVKLDELPLWLKQNEKDLIEANREGTSLETELRRMQWKSDKLYAKKYEIEENMLKLAQDQLITDKASQYRLKLLREAQETRRGTELNLALVQSQLSDTLLDTERYRGILVKLNQEHEELEKKLHSVDHNAELIVAEMHALETQIDIKMKKIDRLSSRLEEINRMGEEAAYSVQTKKVLKWLNYF